MKKRLTQRAFTIAEMIIIIAVIGILAAIIVPALLKTSDKADYSADQNAILTFNNVLDSAVAMKEKFEDISRVRSFLLGKGYSEDAFLPASIGDETHKFAFVWDKKQCAVLMVNLIDGVVAAPDEYEGETNSGYWFFLAKPDGTPASDDVEAQEAFYSYPCARTKGLVLMQHQINEMTELQQSADHVFVALVDISFTYDGTVYPIVENASERNVRVYAQYDGSKAGKIEALGNPVEIVSASAKQYNDSTASAYVWVLSVNLGDTTETFRCSDPIAEYTSGMDRCAGFDISALTEDDGAETDNWAW